MSGGTYRSADAGGLLAGLLGPVEVRAADGRLAGIAQPMLRALAATLYEGLHHPAAEQMRSLLDQEPGSSGPLAV